MNPLAALLASLTGAAPGQTANASTSSEGAGSGLFAGLLADAGQQGTGDGAVPGVSNGLFPGADALSGDLLLALGGENAATGSAALAQLIHIDNVDRIALADFGLSAEEIDGLLDTLAGEGGTLTLGEALTRLAEADGGLPELSEEQLDELLRQIKPQGDDTAVSDAVKADAAPEDETDTTTDDAPADAGQQQALLFTGPTHAPGAAPADGGQAAGTPGVGPAQTAPANPGASPASPNAAPAGQAQGSASAVAPTPHNNAASPAPVAPQAAAAAAADAQAGQQGAPLPQAGTDQPQTGQPNQAAASSTADSGLNNASRIGGAPAETAAGSPQGQSGTEKSSLETLLQPAQRSQGAESIKTDTAVTGAADASTAPQPTRSAAPVSAPPQAQAVPISTIAVSIAQQAQTGSRRFEVRLDPPELGRVEVRMEVTREGHATTHLVVERSETLDMLQRDARQLERALQNAGLNTSDGDLTFSLKDQGQAHDGARGDTQQRADGKGPSEEAAEDAWQPLPSRNVSSSGLDIRI